MITEHKCCRNRKCYVEKLTLGVHVLHYIEHCNVVCKVCDQAGRAALVHAELAAYLAQRCTEGLCNPLNHGERANQNYCNLSAYKQAAFKRNNSCSVRFHHDVHKRELDFRLIFKYCNCCKYCNNYSNTFAELIKAIYHLGRNEPKTDNDKTCNNNYGDKVYKNCNKADFIGSHVHNQAADYAADWNGNKTG